MEYEVLLAFTSACKYILRIHLDLGFCFFWFRLVFSTLPLHLLNIYPSKISFILFLNQFTTNQKYFHDITNILTKYEYSTKLFSIKNQKTKKTINCKGKPLEHGSHCLPIVDVSSQAEGGKTSHFNTMEKRAVEEYFC